MSTIILGNVTGDYHHFGDTFVSIPEKQQSSLVQDIYDAVVTLQGRKHLQLSEDQKNDYISDLLHQKRYSIGDQSRQGRSGSNNKESYRSGELDITIRQNDRSGTVKSIIEAFELTYCNKKTINDHIEKLNECYDTAGNKENFIIVYAGAKHFGDLWEKYRKFVEEEIFEYKSQIKLLPEDEFSKTKVKIAQNKLEREGTTCKLYHIFADFYLEVS